MDFNAEEKEIRELFESRRLKIPPESLLKDYESGVWKRIRAGQPGPGVGFGVVFSVVLGLALIGFLAVYFGILAPKPKPATVPAPLVDALMQAVSPSPLPVRQAGYPSPPKEERAKNADGASPLFETGMRGGPNTEIDELLEELLILEMLGEAEGVLEPIPAGAIPV